MWHQDEQKLTNESCFVNTVGDISTSETRSKSGESALQVGQVLVGDNLLQVDTEDLLTTIHGRAVDGDVSVETSGTHQGLVKNIRSVGTGQDNHLLGGIEAIHFSEDLVQSAFTLIISATNI